MAPDALIAWRMQSRRAAEAAPAKPMTEGAGLVTTSGGWERSTGCGPGCRCFRGVAIEHRRLARCCCGRSGLLGVG